MPYFEYVMNYDYIVEVLCINKDKPALSCHGTCHLKSQLANANEQKKSEEKGFPQAEEEKFPIAYLEAVTSLILSFERTFSISNTVYSFSMSDFLLSPPSPPPKV